MGVHPESASWRSTVGSPAVFSAASTRPGASSPASHCSQAAISLARSGGGVSKAIAARVQTEALPDDDGRARHAGVEVVIASGAADAAAVVADAVETLLRRKQNAVLGLATGSSPVPVYDELVRRHASRRLSFADASAFLLDEYVGLPRRPPGVVPGGDRAGVHGARRLRSGARQRPGRWRCRSDRRLRAPTRRRSRDAGGVDLQLLGIGSDGHIGFNEPGSSLASRTRLKTLTTQTRADNARFFGSVDEVPHHVLTQGIGTILEARHLVLVAHGERKADAVARTVEGPVSAFFPASALQLHPHVSVVVDESAATALTLADYYREAYAGKPAGKACRRRGDPRGGERVARSGCVRPTGAASTSQRFFGADVNPTFGSEVGAGTSSHTSRAQPERLPTPATRAHSRA